MELPSKQASLLLLLCPQVQTRGVYTFLATENLPAYFHFRKNQMDNSLDKDRFRRTVALLEAKRNFLLGMDTPQVPPD